MFRSSPLWTCAGLLLIALLGSTFGHAETQPRVVKIAQELIRAQSINPPGNEERAAQVLARWLEAYPEITVQQYAAAAGRTNLIARLPGKGLKPPLILLGHLDVVDVNPDEWVVPPFEGRIEEGYLWGRGAIDMKGMLAMELEALIQVAERDEPLDGDLLLVAVADEESGGAQGAEWLLETHGDLLRAGAVVNEGAIGIHREDYDLFPIQVAEKGVCWLKLTAQGRSGHGSMPHRENAALRLASAMDKIGNHEFPLEQTDVVATLLRRTSPYLPFPESLIMGHLFTPVIGPLFRAIARPYLKKNPPLFASLTQTAAPTRLEAGFKVNVIPNEAVGYVDARILPGQTPEGFRDELQQLVGPDITLEIIISSLPNESSREQETYHSIVKVLQRNYPEAVIAPIMSAGATDSRFFRERGIPSYGFIPLMLDHEDLSGLHGKNERIRVNQLPKGVEILKEIISEVLQK